MGIKPKASLIRAIFYIGALVNFAAAQDFQAARNAIENAGPMINYTTFCSDMPGGEDKIACRIQRVPSVGFLVCKTPTVEGESCLYVTTTELNNLVQLGMSGVSTVTVNPPLIENVSCASDIQNTSCAGFLEGWVENAMFEQIRDHISDGTVEELINEVKQITTQGRLNITADDLKTIVNYMEVDPDNDQYRQICDLQGFFLMNGGFLVSDVPSIDDLGINGSCFDGEPTTEQVLMALNNMIEEFDGGQLQDTDSTGGATHTNGVSTWITMLTAAILTAMYAVFQ